VKCDTSADILPVVPVPAPAYSPEEDLCMCTP
jgi:hypothetical protein